MISTFFVLVACGLAQIATAVPLAIRADTDTSNTTQSVTDTQVLQFALTLENLESAFYQKYTPQFTDEDFAAAGYDAWVRPRFMQIAEHEQIHVNFLSEALGNNTVAPCDYNFPVTDVNSFVALSQMLEAVGTAAYAGSAQLLQSKGVITTAASILITEASHAAWIQSAVRKDEPWSGSFGNYLDMTQAYTLASAFITSCPESNPTLPVQSFPELVVVGEYAPGSTITIQYDLSTSSSTSNSTESQTTNSTNSTIEGRSPQGLEAAFSSPEEFWKMLQEAANILSTVSTTSTASTTTTATATSSTVTTTHSTTTATTHSTTTSVTTSTKTSSTTSTSTETAESTATDTVATTTATSTESTSTATSTETPTPSASAQAFLALIQGINTTFVPLTLSSNGTEAANGTVQASATLPVTLQGTIFAVVTTSDSMVSDNNTIAGPVLLAFPFNSTVENDQ